MNISLEAQIKEVERELKMREKVFPRWIKDGRMREPVAKSRINALKAVLNTLQQLHDNHPDQRSQGILFNAQNEDNTK